MPVSGKNLFPSNIAGLPTWYTIRANKHGYIARKKEIDFLVAMNPETAREDVLSLEPGCGGRLRRAAEARTSCAPTSRSIPVPFDKIVARGLPGRAPAAPRPQHDLRRRAGPAALHRPGRDGHGADAHDEEEGQGAGAQPGGAAGRLRLRRASTSPTGPSRCAWSAWTRRSGQILIEGNAAAALGCLMAGVTVVAWYPITPSSSLVRDADRLPAQVPHGPGDRQGHLRGGAGRGRDRGARHGGGRRRGRARDR